MDMRDEEDAIQRLRMTHERRMQSFSDLQLCLLQHFTATLNRKATALIAKGTAPDSAWRDAQEQLRAFLHEQQGIRDQLRARQQHVQQRFISNVHVSSLNKVLAQLRACITQAEQATLVDAALPS